MSGFRGSHGNGDEADGCGFYSARQMRRILRRERLLADRFGGGVALLTFTPRDGGNPRAGATHLAQGLQQRVRFSDEVGWLDEQRQRLGVIMHRTPAATAWKLADDVCAALPAAVAPPLCEVYYYPLEPAEHERAGAMGSAGAWPKARAQPVAPHDAGRPATEARKAVRPMDALFVLETPLGKRWLDVLAAATALLLLSPLLLLVVIAIKLFSPGPVFFRQWRTGLGGKRFEIYKFRSMSVDAEEKKRWLMAFNEQDGPAFKIAYDPRITTIGRFLRRSNIDELPQLWNILKGDMTIVGPRPLPCKESDACSRWQKQRLDVLPGLTCIWQVRGTRDSFDEWVRMDLQYAYQRSLLSDLKLILSTIPIVLLAKRRG